MADEPSPSRVLTLSDHKEATQAALALEKRDAYAALQHVPKKLFVARPLFRDAKAGEAPRSLARRRRARDDERRNERTDARAPRRRVRDAAPPRPSVQTVRAPRRSARRRNP